MRLKICTFNIRCDVQADGVNSFDRRKNLILREFPKYEADIIGFQEVLPHVREWLEENLSGYAVAGTGRSADYGGEHTVIAYRTERLRLVSLDTFWLSDTPRVPGSRFATDQSVCPRICTAAVFLARDTNRLLRVYNTHLDHVGPLARAQGMTLILTRIAQDDALYPGVPVVLTGDFNARPDSPVIAQTAAFSSCGSPLCDLSAQVDGSFHAYHPDRTMLKIDYIFTNAACTEPARALTDTENGVFFSDHYPLLAEIDL